MKRVLLVLLALALVQTACSIGPAPTPEIIYVEVTAVPTPVPPTAVPPTETPVPERLEVMGVDLELIEVYLAPSVNWPPKTHKANTGFILLVVIAESRHGLAGVADWPRGSDTGSAYVAKENGERVNWGVMNVKTGDSGELKILFAIPKGDRAEDYTLFLAGGVEVPLAPFVQ